MPIYGAKKQSDNYKTMKNNENKNLDDVGCHACGLLSRQQQEVIEASGKLLHLRETRAL